MPSINDKFTDTRESGRPNSARVATARAIGAESLVCDNLTGWPTDSKVHFVTYQVDSNNNPISSTQLDCTGIVATNTITSLTIVDGTDTGNIIGDVVEMMPTAAWGQDLSEGLIEQHYRTGAHSIVTADSVTTPIVSTDTISEKTTTNGVTIDGLNIKDSNIQAFNYDQTPTISNPYKFRAYRGSSNQTISTGAYVKVQLNAEDYDTNNNFDSSTNYRYTAPVAGFYQFNGKVENNGTGLCMAWLYKNGSQLAQGSRTYTTITNGGSMVSDIIQLAANDYIELYVYSDNATIQAASYLTYLSGFLVSRT